MGLYVAGVKKAAKTQKPIKKTDVKDAMLLLHEFVLAVSVAFLDEGSAESVIEGASTLLGWLDHARRKFEQEKREFGARRWRPEPHRD